MVINHLLTGMILQVDPSSPLPSQMQRVNWYFFQFFRPIKTLAATNLPLKLAKVARGCLLCKVETSTKKVVSEAEEWKDTHKSHKDTTWNALWH